MSNTKYKNTDIGMLPSEWEVSSFSNYAAIERGGSPRPIEKYLTNSVNGVNWIKIGDVAPNDKYITKTKEKIIRDGIIHSREVKEGDFILSNSMSFGRPYILKIDGCIHDGWLVIKDFNDDFDKDFLYYLLSSDSIQNQYVGLVVGSGVKNLNKDIVKKVLVIKPDSKEQQKIATTLTHIDNLINDYEKLIKKKEAIKKGMMQELLTGKKRLKGYNEKWEKYKLEDIVNRLDNKRVPVKATLRKSGYTPYYGANGIQDYVDGYTHDGENILVAEDGANDLKNYPVFCVNGRIWVNNHAHVLKAKNDNYSNEFISLLLKGVDFENIIVGSSRAKLNSKALMQIELLIPKIKEQQAISAIILNHKNQIDNLNIKLNKLKSLKKSMMSNLFTGKIRL